MGQAKPLAHRWSAFKPTTGLRGVWPGQTLRNPVVGFQAHHWVVECLARPNPSQPGGRLSGPPLGCGVFGPAKPFATWWSAFQAHHWVVECLARPNPSQPGGRLSGPPLGCGEFGQAKPFATWWSAFRPTIGLRGVGPGQTLRNLVVGCLANHRVAEGLAKTILKSIT